MKSVFSVAFLLVIIVASLIFDGSFEREAIGNMVSVPTSITGNNVSGSSSITGNNVSGSSSIPSNSSPPPGIYGNSLEKDIKTSINRFTPFLI